MDWGDVDVLPCAPDTNTNDARDRKVHEQRRYCSEMQPLHLPFRGAQPTAEVLSSCELVALLVEPDDPRGFVVRGEHEDPSRAIDSQRPRLDGGYLHVELERSCPQRFPVGVIPVQERASSDRRRRARVDAAEHQHTVRAG